MDEVSTYTSLINPNTGVNGPDILTQIADGIPFLTIDYVYQQFRIIFPPSTLTVLTTAVQEDAQTGNPPVSLNLTAPISYDLLIISNPNANATLTINGAIGVSILLSSVQLNIDTNIIVPFDPFVSGQTDVPVIVSSDFLDVGSGYVFNILSTNPDALNKSRDIISSTGFVIISDIDATNSIININNPLSNIYSSNFVIVLFKPATVKININTRFLLMGPDIVSAAIRYLNTRAMFYPPIESMIPATPLVPSKSDKNSAVSPIKSSPVEACLTFTEWIGTNKLNSTAQVLSSGTFVVSLVTAAAITGYAMYKFFNCPQPVKTVKKVKKLDTLDKLTLTFIRSAGIESKVKSLSSRLQQSTGIPEFTGAGSIINGTPDTLPGMFLTNVDSIVTTINLVDVVPFDDTTMDASGTSEYTLVQDNDSYNNSGSIFRRFLLITSSYTLTQFDANVFLIDASSGNIVITIPIGVISKNRLMRFKRIDSSSNTVIITSPGGIDGCMTFGLNSCKKKKKLSKRLPYVELYGDGNKLWIFK